MPMFFTPGYELPPWYLGNLSRNLHQVAIESTERQSEDHHPKAKPPDDFQHQCDCTFGPSPDGQQSPPDGRQLCSHHQYLDPEAYQHDQP